MFKPVTGNPNVQDVEQEQLDFWREANILKRTMTEREGNPRYVFYEGPPTANGRPGSHHVLARAFKDIFPRYKTMNGYYVLRKAGWDTHGLPVEIAVEKELGFEHKHEIEEYGIAEFNAKCKESVLRYIDEWEQLTERIAFWVDTDEAYYTFTNDYIESVWWILSEFWNRDLLYQGYKVVPYCPRCGTPLANHEVNQGYDTTSDPSLYTRFKVADEDDTYLLAWTTTPWTLPGNVALVVGPEIDYVKLKGENEKGETEYIYVAAALVDPDIAAQGQGQEEEGEDTVRHAVLERLRSYEVVEEIKGPDMVGMRYEPLFDVMETDKDRYYVTHGDFVTTKNGTGIVHMAPAFGADDLTVGQREDLPVLVTVAPDGTFIDAVEPFAGMWVKDADPKIVENLDERGLLYAHGEYEHRYPFCWRCDTPLLYYARPTWFVRTSDQRGDLTSLNQTINWTPDHIRDGRFGNWLENNVDWALGRERYWGTPLPVWICDECDHQHCVSGVEELNELTGTDQSELDLHRPYVDEVTWACGECDDGTMRRVPELIDVWFDSGAMPYAQWGYPHHNKEQFEAQYPADYICEAMDQTRGWFYSLHAISTLLFHSVAYKNVICLGLIMDDTGKKMSKSRGNVVAPWDVLDTVGADIFRWYLFTASPPGETRRFSMELVGQAFRSFWLTLWHTYRLFVDYANLDGINPMELEVGERTPMDNWILSKLNVLVRDITDAFENYDVTGATRPIERFVIDDLSNWYVRRSKQRLWRTDDDQDKAAAYATLYEVLVTLSKLLAPAMPFMADEMYRNLVGSVDEDAPPSVHLAEWPAYDADAVNDVLMAEMNTVTDLVSLGLAARNNAGIKVRQPLAEVAFALPGSESHVVEKYSDIMADELNVKAVTVLDEAESVVEYTLNPLPSELGPRFKGEFPKLQAQLRETSKAQAYAETLLAGDPISVEFQGETHELTPEEVEVRTSPAAGFEVVEEGAYLAALRTEISDDLAAEGLAREFIRRVQVLRQDADFDIDARIHTEYAASDKLAQAVEAYQDLIKQETLSEDLRSTEQPDGVETATYDFDEQTLTLAVTPT